LRRCPPDQICRSVLRDALRWRREWRLRFKDHRALSLRRRVKQDLRLLRLRSIWINENLSGPFLNNHRLAGWHIQRALISARIAPDNRLCDRRRSCACEHSGKRQCPFLHNAYPFHRCPARTTYIYRILTPICCWEG